MKIVTVPLYGFVFLLCASAAPLNLTVPENARELYEDFKLKFKKNYANTADDAERFEIFKNNLIRIQKIQSEELGTAQYGITMFADLTPEEFSAKMAGFKPETDLPPMQRANMKGLPNRPPSFDWREKGAINPVESQGDCGCCWAFASVAAVESRWFIKKGKLYVLSKQQLVDCDKTNHGCSSGNTITAMTAIANAGGLMLQKDYPYEFKTVAQTCRVDKTKLLAAINGFEYFGEDENDQADWLAANGPFASSVHSAALQHYKGGIIHPPNCPTTVDHAVFTVGYGEENGTPYWIVRNSWSQTFGEDGYFRIYRGDGTCGINSITVSAKIE